MKQKDSLKRKSKEVFKDFFDDYKESCSDS